MERRVKSDRASRLDWDMPTAQWCTGQTLKGKMKKYSLTVARVKGRGDGVEKLLDRAGEKPGCECPIILPESH